MKLNFSHQKKLLFLSNVVDVTSLFISVPT